MTTLRFALALMVAAAWTGALVVAADVQPTRFEDALAAAKANVSSPEGEKYDLEFGKQFGERYGDTMGRCTTDVPEAELANFDLLIRLSGEGKVEEALIQPSTKVATCLRDDVLKGVFVKPPRATYWVQIEMSLQP